MKTFGILHLFCGLGGAALGFQEASGEHRGVHGSFATLAGVDVDPEACADFETLTGAPAARLDLFSRDDYKAFHGREPGPGWTEATAADLRAATGGIAPDVVAMSPPCKGFSALLPAARAEDPKYQALNRLVIRGLALTIEAFASDLPAIILLENVPRITSRGAGLLVSVKDLLGAQGYVFSEGYHDCGEIGGLAQHRRRYLLIARLPGKVPAFVYQPAKRRVRAIGEVIGPLPLPDDKTLGPLHRLPRLKWRTWVRLALIPAGGDWRDLEGAAWSGRYRIVPWDGASGTVTSGDGPSCHAPAVQDPRWFDGAYKVGVWDQPAGTVTSGHAPSCGRANVADPRLSWSPRKGVYQVAPWDQPAGAVVGHPRVGGSNGVAAVADPRLSARAGRHLNKYRVEAWADPAHCVTGSDRLGSGAPSVADPRFNNVYRVVEWGQPAGAVTGGSGPSSSGTCVADPRLPASRGETYKGSPGLFGVLGWDKPSGAITGAASVSGSNCPAAVADPRPNRHHNQMRVEAWGETAHCVTGGHHANGGAPSVADPRLGCRPFSGGYGVIPWTDPAPAVTGAGDVHAQGAAAIADPRLPADNDQPDPPPVIMAADGTWHRPLTTLELAVLQGLPTHMRDGRPLTLAGNADSRWRERIGNAVPVGAARAIGEVVLAALLPAMFGEWVLGATPIWVTPGTRDKVVYVRE